MPAILLQFEDDHVIVLLTFSLEYFAPLFFWHLREDSPMGLCKSMLILPSLKSHDPSKEALVWRGNGSVLESYLNNKSDSL